MINCRFGSPEVNAVKQGGSIKIATEFPSNKNEKNETRAGIFLLKYVVLFNYTHAVSYSLFRIVKKADAKGEPTDSIKMR